MITAANICRQKAEDEMKHIIILIIVGIACLIQVGGNPAGKEPECPTARNTGSDIAAYKQNYQPVEYFPEAALWQAADIMLLIVLLLTATIFGRTGKNRMFWIFAVIGLGYFGLIRGGCICPVGAVANVTTGLMTPERVGRATVIFFLLPLAAAFFAGRIFCVTACPIGACQHLAAGRKPLILPGKINKILLFTAPLLLAAVCYQAIVASCMLICIIDPYKPVFFFGHAWFKQSIAWMAGTSCEHRALLVCTVPAWIIFAGVMILSRWLTRPFCRWLCPYGVLLGFFSAVGFRRRRITQEKCIKCLECRNSCPVQAITITHGQPVISAYSCIQCNRCTNTCRQHAVVVSAEYAKNAKIEHNSDKM
jgi:polyferredoxin